MTFASSEGCIWSALLFRTLWYRFSARWRTPLLKSVPGNAFACICTGHITSRNLCDTVFELQATDVDALVAETTATAAELSHRKTEVKSIVSVIRASVEEEYKEFHDLSFLSKHLDRSIPKEFSSLEVYLPTLLEIYRFAFCSHFVRKVKCQQMFGILWSCDYHYLWIITIYGENKDFTTFYAVLPF